MGYFPERKSVLKFCLGMSLWMAFSAIRCQDRNRPADIPVFDADSAYRSIKTQVGFGPRVPNSQAHRACGDYLIKELTRLGGHLHVQEADLVGFDGKVLKARNIIASYQRQKSDRILLLAHWDSRPWSDQDPDPANRNKPVDGANDGASGVGILMEIARHLGRKSPAVGVDIFLTDMEDYGAPRGYPGAGGDESWCLGTQYWTRQPHVPGYRARYGILLDMVGASGAVFPKEGYSMRFAPQIVEKVWSEAQALGFASFFLNRTEGFITDDHVPVSERLGIPTIDIIHLTAAGFGDYWHTQKDTLQRIDRQTLRAVGQTLLNVIYKETSP